MRRASRQFAQLATAMALSALCLHCAAQFSGGGGMGGGGMGGGHRGRSSDSSSSPRADDAANNPATQAARLRDKLLDLRLRLMITSAQTTQWDAFYAKAWDLASRNSLKPAESDDLSALQAINQRADTVQQRATQWHELAEATDKLYQALSEDQRRIADSELPGVLPP